MSNNHIVGYSYLKDIKQSKGRKERKIFPRSELTEKKHKTHLYGAERIAAGDPQFTKFLEKKERAHH